MAPGVALREGDPVRLTAAPVEGTAGELSLWPRSVFAALRVGSLVTIDFDGAQVRVCGVGEEHAEAVVVDAGKVRSDKGVVVDPAPTLPALTDKDRTAIALGMARGIRHVALSFASSAADVELVRSLAPAAQVIAKIESGAGFATRTASSTAPTRC